MLEELELMRKRTVSHEQAVNTLSSVGAHFQVLIDNLGAAVAMQDGRVAGLEQHTAQHFSSTGLQLWRRSANRRRLPSRRRLLRCLFGLRRSPWAFSRRPRTPSRSMRAWRSRRVPLRTRQAASAGRCRPQGQDRPGWRRPVGPLQTARREHRARLRGAARAIWRASP